MTFSISHQSFVDHRLKISLMKFFDSEFDFLGIFEIFVDKDFQLVRDLRPLGEHRCQIHKVEKVKSDVEESLILVEGILEEFLLEPDPRCLALGGLHG